MENPADETTGPGPKRRPYRASVRALMLAVVGLALGLGWVVERARVQREAVAAVEKSGGKVFYDWQLTPAGTPNPNAQPPGPKWLVERLGVDYFGSARAVMLGIGQKVSESDLEKIGRLDGIETLYASQAVGITDVGVAHLRGLTRLTKLRLGQTQITSASLPVLRGMTGLKELHLDGIPLADADLASLEGLTGLEILNLNATKVTDAGLAHLRPLDGLKHLMLGSTELTGPGLAHLAGMTRLERLWLGRSNLADLSALPTLPNLKWIFLEGTSVDDSQLPALSRLPALEMLSLDQTKVTDAGLPALDPLKGTLTSLRLSGTKVTDAAAPEILKFEKLTILQLANTKITDATLDQLPRLKKLQTLNLAGIAATDAGLARLRQALPQAKTLQELVGAANARSRAAADASKKTNPKP